LETPRSADIPPKKNSRLLPFVSFEASAAASRFASRRADPFNPLKPPRMLVALDADPRDNAP
jgi:hypothetical protein